MAATMKEIAQRAGVSKSTVSRALSGDPRVNEETRAKILKIAQELDYRPNILAQALAMKRTNMIGVMIPKAPRSVADPFFLEFLGGIGDVATRMGFGLMLPAFRGTSTDEFREVFAGRRVDGVILTEPETDDDRIDYLRRQGVPFVFQGDPRKAGEDISWVDVDNSEAAFAAVDHLLSLGHTRIASIAGEDKLVSGTLRRSGYERAIHSRGIDLDPQLVAVGDFTESGGYKAAQILLERGIQFTAVFAANDLMAIGAIRCFKDQGISIPDDISVIGFDGTRLSKYVDPPLTTVQLPIAKLGEVAAELLIDGIRGKSENGREVVLPFQVLVRDSTRRLDSVLML